MQTEIANMRETKAEASLSVVLLCFNDAATIGNCVQQAFEVLGPAAKDLEVIVVEDGSSDQSKQVLRSLTGPYPSLKVVYHSRNMGYGASLADGILAATKKYVLCVDGDSQFDLKDAANLFDIADGRYQIVSGCRTPRADPWYRCAAGWIFNQLVHLVFTLPVKDVDCGFKLLHRAAAQRMFPTRSNLLVWVEALIKAKGLGYRCADIVVHHRPRSTGRSTVFRLSGILQIMCELVLVGLRFKVFNAISRPAAVKD
jgi:glycosyltransferase involved in cell wall biosynthesis